MNALSASTHALDRYRLHYPDAGPRELVAAASLAPRIPSSSAFALVGRSPDLEAGEGEEHRLHLEGSGIFVVVPRAHGDPARAVVRTYLRFVSDEQRRMARVWFLDPLGPLREAFELGFDAARAPNAPPLAITASHRHTDALAALATRLAASGPPMSAPRADAAPEPAHASSDRRRVIDQEVWSDVLDALIHVTATDPAMVGDVQRWVWLNAEGAALVFQLPHAGQSTEDAVLVEPGGRAAALAVRDGERMVFRRILLVPSTLRHRLLAQVTDAPPAPRSRAGLPRVAHAEPPPPTPAAPCALPRSCFVLPDAFEVKVWSGRAAREAGAAGYRNTSLAWLHHMAPVPPDELYDLVARAGLELSPGRWAGRRYGDLVLLRQAPEGGVPIVSRLLAVDGG